MKPSDLGLPRHFTEYREGQLDAAIQLATSSKRFRFNEAPPGRGKSLINMTVGRLRASDGRTLILTGTKNLGAQMMADFADVGLTEALGMSNYRCVAADRHLSALARRNASCDEGPCRAGIKCEYKSDGGCHYYDARRRASEAEIVSTNYAYWMNLGRNAESAGALGVFDTLILDEAHTVPGWLTSFCTVRLDKDETKQLLGLDLPPINEGVAVWSEWAGHAHTITTAKLKEQRKLLESAPPDERKRAIRRILRLQDLERGLGELAGASRWRRSEGTRLNTRMPGLETDWAVERYETRTEHGVQFSPVWPHAYAEQYIFRGIPNVILTSGTMNEDLMKYLGIPKKDAVYSSMDSIFDPKRHPTFIIPVVRVDRNNGEGEKRLLVNAIDQIIASRPDRKGLIHARSYDRMADIIRLSKHKDKLISHSRGGASLSAGVAKFKKSSAPSVLISPAATEGVDLPYDDCRYVIIVKVPFLDGRSELIKARAKSDSGYLNYEAALAMVQQAGRGMRASDDACEVFILDAHMSWFADRARWPKWFKRTWQYVTRIPPPLRLEGAMR